MRKCLIAVLAGLLIATVAGSAGAQSQTFILNMDGHKEFVGGQFDRGDLDATGIGTITLNPGTTGNTASADVHIMLSNIAFPLSLWHIHTGAAGVQGGVFIDFGNPETYRSGDMMMGTVPNLSAANMQTVLANPSGFYLNIHNGAFPSGAIRDQLGVVPEPTALALVGIGGLAMLRRRRSAA